MFYLVDLSSTVTSSYMIAVGLILVVLVIAFPKGIIGAIRQAWGGARP
jgi:branched-chain amino acid transport system permease protein